MTLQWHIQIVLMVSQNFGKESKCDYGNIDNFSGIFVQVGTKPILNLNSKQFKNLKKKKSEIINDKICNALFFHLYMNEIMSFIYKKKY